MPRTSQVLQNEHLGEAEITAFAQEMAVSASMTHPNVLKTFGVCVCPPDVSLVYEYCSRGSLLGLLPLLQTWDWPRKISLMLQIARGVTYLHVRGTIHRDLKPDNVLITEDWTAKVADFGLTRIINGDRATDSGLWYDVSGWCCAGTLGELESKIPMFNSAEESEFSRDSGKGESKASSIDVALVAGPYSKASRTSTPTSSSSR
jgi:serine/threonine protein kinase